MLLRVSQYEAEHVVRRRQNPSAPLMLTDAFGEVVMWCWRNDRPAAARSVADLVSSLKGKVTVQGALIEAVLDALPMVLHPTERDGEGGAIAASLRPDVVSVLGQVY
jgi:hypothetical protein